MPGRSDRCSPSPATPERLQIVLRVSWWNNSLRCWLHPRKSIQSDNSAMWHSYQRWRWNIEHDQPDRGVAWHMTSTCQVADLNWNCRKTCFRMWVLLQPSCKEEEGGTREEAGKYCRSRSYKQWLQSVSKIAQNEWSIGWGEFSEWCFPIRTWWKWFQSRVEERSVERTVSWS